MIHFFRHLYSLYRHRKLRRLKKAKKDVILETNQPSGYIITGNDNKVFIIENGIERQIELNERIPGVNIHTKGYNSSENGYVKITTSDPIQPIPIDINVNDVITYDDLIGSYVTWLRLNCANVDGYTSQVTAPLMTGYSSVIPGTTIPVTIVESTVIPTITNAQCKNQIDTYLTNCGLYNGQNTLVKTVDLLKYYDALAAFSAAKLVTVCSQFASSVILMYNTNANVPTITLPTNVLPTKAQIQTLTTEFTNMVNRTSKMHTITYTIG